MEVYNVVQGMSVYVWRYPWFVSLRGPVGIQLEDAVVTAKHPRMHKATFPPPMKNCLGPHIGGAMDKKSCPGESILPGSRQMLHGPFQNNISPRHTA